MTTTMKATPHRRPERSKRVLALLDKVTAATAEIRGAEKSMARASEARRKACIRLWEEGVTYREMADAMGATEQAVYKVIRAHIASMNPQPELLGERTP